MKTILQARFDEKRIAKIDQIKAQTGLTVSQIFRQLVDAAEIKPAQISVKLSQKAENDITRQGNSVVVAS